MEAVFTENYGLEYRKTKNQQQVIGIFELPDFQSKGQNHDFQLQVSSTTSKLSIETLIKEI